MSEGPSAFEYKAIAAGAQQYMVNKVAADLLIMEKKLKQAHRRIDSLDVRMDKAAEVIKELRERIKDGEAK